MPGFLIRLVVNAIAVWVAAQVVGIQTDGVGGILIIALALGVVNALIKPILFLITLPLTIITLGLFTLVLNALMFWLALWLASLAGSATIPDFWTAFLGALVVSVVSWVLSLVIK